MEISSGASKDKTQGWECTRWFQERQVTVCESIRTFSTSVFSQGYGWYIENKGLFPVVPITRGVVLVHPHGLMTGS